MISIIIPTFNNLDYLKIVIKSKFLDIGAGMGTFSTVLFHQLLEFHDKDHILNNMIYLVEIKGWKCEYLKLLGFKNIYNTNDRYK